MGCRQLRFTSHGRELLEANLSCRQPIQHGIAIVSAGIRAQKAAGTKHIESYVVGIRPDAHFRVVIEVGVWKDVTVISAGGIRSGGYGHALKKRSSSSMDHKLGEDPTVSQFVINHDRVAVVAGFTIST